MTEDDLDRNRRHFLTVATLVTGAAGAGMADNSFSVVVEAECPGAGAGRAGRGAVGHRCSRER